jgi:septal ring factor EnvC (AmiA/AmiB activator)
MPLSLPFVSRAPGAAAAAVAAMAALVLPAAAQQQPLRITPSEVDQAPAANTKAARERELERIRAEQRKAAENEARLKAEIASIGQDRTKFSRTLIETASRLREAEGRVGTSEARLASLDEQQTSVRKSLEARRAAVAELLAALQRIGRKPPPALLVRPEDALDAVRSAIMLGAVLPEMRAEAETLAQDLTKLVSVRRELVEEREALARDMTALAEERRRMELLIEARQRRQADAEKALEAERQRVIALARQADTLKELIAKLGDESVRPVAPPNSASPALPPKDIPRLGPAVAFAHAKGTLKLPVNGIKMREFGAPDGLGSVEKGLSVATRSGAQVTAPSDGWVVYAGPFRSYGQLLILNAGGGYHILLAGMERISVDLGQFVLTGEPVAIMGSGPRTAAAAAMGTSQPILYIEFRKDGTPVDPGPWWAVTDSEKVRG